MTPAAADADLGAKQAITELLYTYCRGLDRLDREMFASIWHPGATVDYGPTYKGTAAGLVDVFMASHAQLAGHSHQVTNILIEVDGDRAASEAYVTGTLWKVSKAGVPSHLIAVGRYVDQWSRREGRWGIDHRNFINDYVRTSPVSDEDDEHSFARLAAARTTATTKARRDRTDPSYEVMGQLG